MPLQAPKYQCLDTNPYTGFLPLKDISSTDRDVEVKRSQGNKPLVVLDSGKQADLLSGLPVFCVAPDGIAPSNTNPLPR
jgi:hypothetical protein